MKNTSHSLRSAMALAFAAALLAISPGVAADPSNTLNTADVKFIKHEAAAGMAEVKLAELGAKKASHADVKAFAELIITDHTQANEALKKLATTKGVDLSSVIDPAHAETYQKLEQHSGTDFDQHFLDTMVSDHKMCVGNFETAATEAQDGEVKMFAVKTLPTLKAHLDRAQALSTNTTKEADNTARNMRDRDGKALTPLDQGTSKSDTEITAQIRRDIIATKDMSTNAQNVKIITTNGKVTLRGPVNTAEEKRLIGQIAERIVRIEHIDSQLEVK